VRTASVLSDDTIGLWTSFSPNNGIMAEILGRFSSQRDFSASVASDDNVIAGKS